MVDSEATLSATRMKRNSACTSCRDAKVRCNPSSRADQPCQRCAKLSLPCVVDKTHKRVSRKSKIDELVQEIENIKQTVGEHVVISPRHAAHHTPKDTVLPQIGIQSVSTTRPSVSIPSTNSGSIQTPVSSLVNATAVEPSQPRALGSHPFTGEDIDYYFQKYFEHFHPHMPIVRQRDPNKCYESGSLLFWTIIMIACRRYARDPSVPPFLLESIRPQLMTAMTTIPITIHTINALILVSAWPLPDVRFLNDPTPIITGSLINICMLLGIHTGKGAHPEFSLGVFQNSFTDEEAACTWAGCNIISQRMGTYLGLLPINCLFNQTIQNVIDGKSLFHVPSSFRVALECSKFINRVSRTMSATFDDARGVSPHFVKQLEEEFDNTRGLICSERADTLDRFNALLVELEIRTYYLMPLPGYDAGLLKRNIMKAYTTAQTVIRTAIELGQQGDALLHTPHYYWRGSLGAICIIFKVFRSSYADFVDRKQAESCVLDFIELCRRLRHHEEDITVRLANMLDTIWYMGPASRWHDEPICAFSHRLSASVSFECLRWFKHDMDNARPKSQPPPTQNDMAPSALAGPDPLPNIDWSFMADFDWSIEPALLGPAA
ncbi:hypothetical protein BX600DRAFT_221555 [Xylariales sp. PMI_506]|nr:hypothetical protein BX600DRAFT_221555 [Xylariales sp. PMI_506]